MQLIEGLVWVLYIYIYIYIKKTDRSNRIKIESASIQ